MLVNPALEAFNPRPQPTSPIINSSNLIDPTALDVYLVQRPQLGGYDLGAVEYRELADAMFSDGFGD
jgi:hypothetical protein